MSQRDPSASVLSAARLQTLAEITDTAARLFAAEGYHGVGVADICKELGIGKAKLYSIIGSKEALLEQIHDVCMTAVLYHAEGVVNASTTASAKLAELGKFMINLIVTRPNHVWVFLHDFRPLTGARGARCRERRRYYEDLVQAVIDEGVSNGEFVVPEARLGTLAWLGLFIHSYTWLRADGPHDPSEVADYFTQLFLQGALPRPRTAPRSSGKAPRTS